MNKWLSLSVLLAFVAQAEPNKIKVGTLVPRESPWGQLLRVWAKGVKELYVCATHAILCADAIEKLRKAPIKQIVVTDSIPLAPHKQLANIKVVSVAPLLAEAIRRIHFNESVSKLFE